MYDGEDIALVFDGTSDLVHRYLHGANTDQELAQEDGAGNVRWLLGDQIGSIRNVADNSGSIVIRTWMAVGRPRPRC